jgi:uncharacterized protein (TIGR02118 family)
MRHPSDYRLHDASARRILASRKFAESDMARMVIVYRTPADVEAFRRRYFETHAPLAKRLPGLRRYEVSDGPIACRGASSDAYMIATLHFDDMAALRSALASEEGQACGTDRQRFAPDPFSFQMFLFESKDLVLSSPSDAPTPKFSRAELHKSAEIAASAGDVWDLLTDWAGMLRWWLTPERGGLPTPTLVSCELIGEHGLVPRTRRMTLDNGVMVEEQIFYQDDNSRRIYYNRTDPPGSPISGYIAAATVDDVEGDRCALHILSSFDVAFPGDPQAAIDRFARVYHSIFRGFQNYFASKQI